MYEPLGTSAHAVQAGAEPVNPLLYTQAASEVLAATEDEFDGPP